MRFQAIIELGGKTATGIPVPDDLVKELGGGGSPRVRVTVEQHSYATSIGRRGGRYMIPLSAANREAAGVAAGDEVDVDVSLDTGSREAEIPGDLADALARSPDAAEHFQALTPTQRSYFAGSVTDAKTAATRARRIDKAIASLRAGLKRPG